MAATPILMRRLATGVLRQPTTQPTRLREQCPALALLLLRPVNVHQVTTGWPHLLTKVAGAWLTEEPTQEVVGVDITEEMLLPEHNVHPGLTGIVTIIHVRAQADRHTILPVVMVDTPTTDRHQT